MEVGLHTIEKHLACLGNTAAQNHHFGVHGRAQAAQELAHVIVELLQNLLCHSITGLGSIEDILGNGCLNGAQGRSCFGGGQMILCQACNAGGGAVLLYAAVLAAVAGHALVGI